MARRSDHTKEELKTIIIDTSWNIVAEDGFAALTARRIAKDIGYAPGTIYNMFQSMDDLYLHVHARLLDKMYEALSKAPYSENPGDITDNLKDMAQRYYSFTKEYKPHWLMLFTHQMPDDMFAPDWFNEKILRIFEPLETILSPFENEKNRKKLRLMARGLWASVHGIFYLEATGKIPYFDDGEIKSLDMANLLIDQFMNGIE